MAYNALHNENPAWTKDKCQMHGSKIAKRRNGMNKVKLELKQEYQALNNHTLNVATLHDACKQVK